MGYHKSKINKGQFGHASKIQEEFEEFTDAYNQGNPVMELLELSDLIGAIEAYTLYHYDIELRDLVKMMEATKSAFIDGERKSIKYKCNRCKSIVNMKLFKCKCNTSPSPWEEVK